MCVHVPLRETTVRWRFAFLFNGSITNLARYRGFVASKRLNHAKVLSNICGGIQWSDAIDMLDYCIGRGFCLFVFGAVRSRLF